MGSRPKMPEQKLFAPNILARFFADQNRRGPTDRPSATKLPEGSSLLSTARPQGGLGSLLSSIMNLGGTQR